MNNKIIATIIAVLMVFICSATAFADDISTTVDAESSTATEVTDSTETDATTVTNTTETSVTDTTEENSTDKTDEGVTIIREDVTLETSESAETEIVIDTSDVSITEGTPQNTIVVDYADTYTDIPTTGSDKVVAIGAFAAVCSTLIGVIVTKKRAQ